MRTLLSGGAFFESPRWHDGRWWVSDFFRRVVLAVDDCGCTEEVAHVDGMPSGLGLLPDVRGGEILDTVAVPGTVRSFACGFP